MRKGLITCLMCILGCAIGLSAQEPLQQDSSVLRNGRNNSADIDFRRDSVSPLIDEKPIILADSIIVLNENKEFKPDSKKAVIYSAIFPGLGQIYNRKYWKLPIIIGGAAGITYAISWNGRVYNDYNQAYRDVVLGTGDSYLNFLPPGFNSIDEYPGGREGLIQSFKRRKDFYRRNRDLAIIVGVGVYALCMLDAYVDAQLYDFDMSPDLSMRVTPVIWGPTSFSKTTVGLQCVITF